MAAPPIAERRRLSLFEQGPLFTAAVFACIALTLAAQLARPAPPDMAFLLYAAGRLLDGATLYRDVVEINPPLVIWLNVPIELLARLTDLSEFLVYRLFTAAAVGGLFSFCYGVVRWYVLPDRPAYGRYFLLLLCFALFPLAGDDFGQREHLVLALLMPYLLLVAARNRGSALRGAAPPYKELAAIGVLTGLALALKPHFVLAWILVAAIQPVRGRWRLTTEVIWTVAFLATYAVIVLLVAPEYLTLAGTLGPSYLRYIQQPIVNLVLLAPGALLVLLSLISAAVLRRWSRAPTLWATIAAGVVGCFLAGLAQQKGLRYHFYPSFALAVVLLGLVAADGPAAAGQLSERAYGLVARALTPTIILVVLGSAALDALGGGPADRKARAEFDDLVGFVRARAHGRPVGVLSYHIAAAFPLVNYAGVPLASRFPHLWLLPVAYWDSLESGGALVYRAPAQMEAPERYLWQAVRQDLLLAQPELLIVLRPARDVARNGLRRLHYIQYFGRDPDLATLFQRYQLVAEKGEFLVYERIREGGRRTGPAPSAAPGERDVARPELREVRLGILDPVFLAGASVFLCLLCLLFLGDRRQSSAEIPAASK